MSYFRNLQKIKFSIIKYVVTALLLVGFSETTLASDIFTQLGIVPKYNKTFPPAWKNADTNEPNIYLLSVELGQLSFKQFTIIKNYFKNQASISYEQNKNYKLEDFLPPAMQALLNKSVTWINQSSIQPPTDEDGNSQNEFLREFNIGSGINSTVNCIGTAYEMARVIETQNGAGLYQLYSPGRINVSSQIESDVTPVTIQNLNFGDVLYVTNLIPNSEEGPQVQHMAVYLTKNIFFEKRDSIGVDPYRLVFFEDIKNRLDSTLGKENTNYKFGKFKKVSIAMLEKDNRNDVFERIKDFISDLNDQKKYLAAFANLSEQIKNAVWVLSEDEIGDGGNIIDGVALVEMIEIDSSAKIHGKSYTTVRIIDALTIKPEKQDSEE